jgi:signal transduction histidine kinase
MTGESVIRQYAHETSAVSEGDSGIRDVLHDLGHQMMTVSLLAEALDSVLPEGEQAGEAARRQAALIAHETVRAMNMIADVVVAAPAAQPGSTGPQLIDVRELAAEVVRLGQLRYAASVQLQPGPAVFMSVDPMLVWRVLTNLADNAARAAGPDGHVVIRIGRAAGTVIEVTDDGDGFGSGPHGLAGRGLSLVAQLVAATGGELDVQPGSDGGSRVRATFGGRCDRIVLPRQGRARAVIA